MYEQFSEAVAKIERIEPTLGDDIGDRELAQITMTASAALVEILVRIEHKLDRNNQVVRDLTQAIDSLFARMQTLDERDA